MMYLAPSWEGKIRERKKNETKVNSKKLGGNDEGNIIRTMKDWGVILGLR